MYQLGHVSHKTCHKIILHIPQYATVEARNKSLVEILWGSYTSRIPSSFNGCGSKGFISRFKRCFTLPNPSPIHPEGVAVCSVMQDAVYRIPYSCASGRCPPTGSLPHLFPPVPALASPRRGHDLPPPSRASVSSHSGRTRTFSSRAWDG